MPYVIGGILAATAIAGVIEADSRKKEAKKSIAKLKAMNVNRSPEDMLSEAKGVIKEGYSPEERANFQGQLQRGQNASFRSAADRNPNLSGAVTAGLNFQKIGAVNQFAASDASLRRSMQNDYVAMLQRKTQNDINNKRDQEIAYGTAKNQANADIFNSLTQLGAAAAVTTGGVGSGGGSMTTDTAKTGATGNAFGGQAPMRSFQNPPQNYGSNEWARGLYGGNNSRSSSPAVNYYTMRGVPSRYAPPAERFDPTLNNYY